MGKGSFFAWCEKMGMEGFDGAYGAIIAPAILVISLIGTTIGVVIGKKMKLPEAEITLVDDDTTINVEIEDDGDLYDDQPNDRLMEQPPPEQNLLELEHDEGNNPPPQLILL